MPDSLEVARMNVLSRVRNCNDADCSVCASAVADVDALITAAREPVKLPRYASTGLSDRLDEARAKILSFVRICDRATCKPCGERSKLVDELIAAAREVVNPRFFYTVGWGQPLFPGYAEVFAADEGEALYKLGVLFGTAWSMRYATEAEIDPADRIKRITIW